MIEITQKYEVEILEHPKDGAQEWFGNTRHLFGVLLDTAVQYHERGGASATTRRFDLYVDIKGDKSPTGTYYWSTHDYSMEPPEGRIRKLYGPVKVRVYDGALTSNI